MRLRDHIYLSAICIPFPSHPINHRLESRRVASQSSSAPPPAWHLVKKRRTEENREFSQDWTESFAFICNTDGLPTCLICHEKLAHNKKSNLERHFTTKHTQFADKYPNGDARKKAVEKLQKKKKSSSMPSNHEKHEANRTATASHGELPRLPSREGRKKLKLKKEAKLERRSDTRVPRGRDATRGEDIANAVQKCLEDNGV
ncbi:hypothetical protein AVEN_105345-1, partial [Araneus ventricosus]